MKMKEPLHSDICPTPRVNVSHGSPLEESHTLVHLSGWMLYRLTVNIARWEKSERGPWLFHRCVWPWDTAEHWLAWRRLSWEYHSSGTHRHPKAGKKRMSIKCIKSLKSPQKASCPKLGYGEDERKGREQLSGPVLFSMRIVILKFWLPQVSVGPQLCKAPTAIPGRWPGVGAWWIWHSKALKNEFTEQYLLQGMQLACSGFAFFCLAFTFWHAPALLVAPWFAIVLS